MSLPERKEAYSFAALKGGGRALEFKGDFVLNPSLESIPYGPLTMEVVFAVENVLRHQYIVYQRGAQASLRIDSQGYLIAERLPENRKHPNPYISLRSGEPLESGKWYHAVISFDGETLRLYLNGKEEGTVACRGTRSSEGFFIGGLDMKSDLMAPVSENGIFSGMIFRISIIGRQWTAVEVIDVYKRLEMLPFWKTKIIK